MQMTAQSILTQDHLRTPNTMLGANARDMPLRGQNHFGATAAFEVSLTKRRLIAWLSLLAAEPASYFEGD